MFRAAGMEHAKGEWFQNRMADLAKKYPNRISGPYGEGMMMAFQPGKGDAEEAKQSLFFALRGRPDGIHGGK